jgi:hypothetical protein
MNPEKIRRGVSLLEQGREVLVSAVHTLAAAGVIKKDDQSMLVQSITNIVRAVGIATEHVKKASTD